MKRLFVLSILWALGARAQICMRLSTSNTLAKMLDSQYEPFTRPTVQTGPANHWAVQSTNARFTTTCKYMRLAPDEVRHLTHTLNTLDFSGVMISVANNQEGVLVEEIMQNFDRALVFSTEPVCKNRPGVKFVQLYPLHVIYSPSVTFEHTTIVPGALHVYVPNQGFSCSEGQPNPAVMCSASPKDLIHTLYPDLFYSKISNCFHRVQAAAEEALPDVSIPSGVLTVLDKHNTTTPPPTSRAPTTYAAPTMSTVAAIPATPKVYKGDPANAIANKYESADEDDSGIFILNTEAPPPTAAIRSATTTTTPGALVVDRPAITTTTSTARKAVTQRLPEEEKPVYSFIKSRGTIVVFHNFIFIMCTCLITVSCTHSLY